MRRRMGARLTALFIVLTLLPSGCLPPPLPRIVKIGLVAPFEGRYRYLGYDAIYAARLAVREINAAGGVAGRQLVLVAYDDRGDPEMARTAARNLAIDPDVAAVVGHYRPESTAAAAPIYANADLPLLAVGGWITGTELPVWHLYPSPGAFAEALLREPGGVPGVVWGAAPLARALRDRAAARTEEAPYIYSVLPPVAAAERLRTSGAGRLLVGGPELATAEFVAVAGDAAEGACAITPYPLPSAQPGMAEWRAAYLAVGPHVPEPGLYALPTYEAVYLLAEALAAAPSSDRAGVTEALPHVRGGILLGEIAWDAERFWNAAPTYVYCWEAGVLHSK